VGGTNAAIRSINRRYGHVSYVASGKVAVRLCGICRGPGAGRWDIDTLLKEI